MQSEPIKVSMPLVEVYTQTFLKEGSGLVTASFPQSGFLHEHGNIGKQTLLTTFAFLWTDRLWEGWSGDPHVSCLLPITTALVWQRAAAACPAGCAGQHAPRQPASLSDGKIIPWCMQPQGCFCQPLAITVTCALLSQMETLHSIVSSPEDQTDNSRARSQGAEKGYSKFINSQANT